jgi:very-short-patch-repair endonuclease
MTKPKGPKLSVVMNRQQPNRATDLIRDAAAAEATRFIEGFETMRERCESPIEELLLAALYAEHTISEYRLHFMMADAMPAEPYFDGAAFVYAQVPIGPYRADFAIHDATLPFGAAKPRIMIVECDGHDFHEKTKEQARRDKQRDRFLVSKGYKLLRFTGSEIWADPEKCADEIIDELAANDEWRNRKR